MYFDLIARPDLLGLVLTALAVGMLGGAALYSGFGPVQLLANRGYAVLQVDFRGRSSTC
ncbi:hypothetical protein [Marinitenerispora sediminis]|uniref:hypothetical protein n=1 Tax=Marinitenerispora sediminis TaxID=1931232 RepID=UPI00131407A4|nr:hypothetical protein [Marinitenerispora sediminis]